MKKNKYIKDFKSGDIIVRVYKSGRTAIGIYYIAPFPNIIYLGLNFYDDGGLTQFEKYGIGDETNYVYRKPTLKEIAEIKKLMSDSKDYEHQLYLSCISKYVNKIRKEKIKFLEKC